MARSVKLTNGGREIKLNEFAEQITENVITGIVETLKGTDLDEEIVITLGKKSGRA